MRLGLHLPHKLNLLEPYRTQTAILGHGRTSNVWIKIQQLVQVAKLEDWGDSHGT